MKSKIFVSPNLSSNQVRSLSNHSGIPLTQNLGKYLGSPLLHTRISKHNFNEVLEKLKSRLSGWKAKNLSLAGRITLIQLVTSTIPFYNMQTMELPRKVCDDIDKINRNFLWGDTENKKKIHLVNWGLGLRKAREQNSALLTKLGWNLLNDNSKLWCQILQSKYLKNHSFFSWSQKKNPSHIWKSIYDTRDILRNCVKWRVGNGETISFWND